MWTQSRKKSQSSSEEPAGPVAQWVWRCVAHVETDACTWGHNHGGSTPLRSVSHGFSNNMFLAHFLQLSPAFFRHFWHPVSHTPTSPNPPPLTSLPTRVFQLQVVWWVPIKWHYHIFKPFFTAFCPRSLSCAAFVKHGPWPYTVQMMWFPNRRFHHEDFLTAAFRLFLTAVTCFEVFSMADLASPRGFQMTHPVTCLYAWGGLYLMGTFITQAQILGYLITDKSSMRWRLSLWPMNKPSGMSPCTIRPSGVRYPTSLEVTSVTSPYKWPVPLMAIAIFPLLVVDVDLISHVFLPSRSIQAHFSFTIKALLGPDIGTAMYNKINCLKGLLSSWMAIKTICTCIVTVTIPKYPKHIGGENRRMMNTTSALKCYS